MSSRRFTILLVSAFAITLLSSCSNTQEIEDTNISYETPVATESVSTDEKETGSGIIEESAPPITENEKEVKMNVVYKPCLAFDALAAMVLRGGGIRDDIPYVKEQIVENFNGLELPSSDSYFRTLMANYSLDEIEAMDLDAFAEAFKECIKGNSYEEQFLEGLEILNKMDFGSLWAEYCLPYLNNQCSQFNSLLEAESQMVSGIFSDIQKLKPDEQLDNANIYLAYFSSSVSFQLSANSFFTWRSGTEEISIYTESINDNLLRLMTHELTHRFSNEKSTVAYTEAAQEDEFLKKTKMVLFEKMYSTSNEEEFVVALDHYICFKNGLATRDETYNSLFNYYEGCMPIAVIMLDELMKLDGLPEDINTWIYDLFANEVIKVGDIENQVNSILPGYSDNFMSNWF